MTHKNCPNNVTALRQGQLIAGCEACIGSSVASGDNAKHQREWQKKQYRGDTLQPVPSQERDFVRHYGADVAREKGYSDEAIRRLS